MLRRGLAHPSSMETILTQRGDYLVFYAEGGQLAADAFSRFRNAAAQGAELIYADEDIRLANNRTKRMKKPEWSPDTLRSCNYIGSPFAASKSLCRAAGLPRCNTSAERYAFLLRIAALRPNVRHIPQVLFTGPAEQTSADITGLREVLRAEGCGGLAMPGAVPGSFCVRYPIPSGTKVSCIAIVQGDVNAVRATLESIAHQNTYEDIEYLVCDGNPIEERRESYYNALKTNGAARVIRKYNERNIPRLCNLAAESAFGDALLFLPAGVELACHDGIERMLEYALLPHIAAVGGVFTNSGDQARGIIHNAPVLGGPMMVSADRFAAQSGFDVTFERVGYIHAFSLLAASMQKFNLITPYAQFLRSRRPEWEKPPEKNSLRLQDMGIAEASLT